VRAADDHLAYLSSIATGLVLLVFFVGPRVTRHAGRLGEAWPELTKKVSSGQIDVDIGQQRGWSGATQRRIQEVLKIIARNWRLSRSALDSHCRERKRYLGAVPRAHTSGLFFEMRYI